MASAQFIVHVTAAGERWDLLAWRYYGDAAKYSPIIMANPDVPIEPVFESGLVILIRVLSVSAVASTGLPPWKTASRSPVSAAQAQGL
ncbi:MAG TPA: tail protein X [Candidatus Binataceae bacterium]|nr:tail protein X [Candidatus Binataceae bacterium]